MVTAGLSVSNGTSVDDERMSISPAGYGSFLTRIANGWSRPRESTPGGTFSTIDLRPSQFDEDETPTDYATALLAKLEVVKVDRHAYFDSLRRGSAAWVNGTRRFVAILGATAFLLTAVTAGLHFVPTGAAPTYMALERAALTAVLVSYALMGAFSFYDRTTDSTSAYFRHVTILLAIRDLWSALEFAVTKCLSQADVSSVDASKATKRQLLALAEAFNKDLNAITAQELTEWKAEFVAALSQLQQASEKGNGDVASRLEALAAAATASAQDAAASAKAMEAASRPGMVNVTVTGDVDGEIAIDVDGVQAMRSTGKVMAIRDVAPGPRTFLVQARKGDRDLETSKIVDIKPGIQDVTFALT